MSVKVKICGVCTVADARAAVEAGADYLGLNFWPRSPRYLTLEHAREIAAAVSGIPLVGVFVNAERVQVGRVAALVGLSAVQFHGDEDVEYCRGWAWTTIKALRAAPGADLVALAAGYTTDYILVDSHVAGRPGGTGVPLDPALALGLPPERLFVGGGLTPATVAEMVRRLRPFAVDVASGVEQQPGRKDHGKIRDFIRAAKAA